jgi:hypothetical protein
MRLRVPAIFVEGSMTAERAQVPLFMALDPDGTIIRIVADEAEFDVVKVAHFAVRLMKELPSGINQETRTRLTRERAREAIPRYKLVRL